MAVVISILAGLAALLTRLVCSIHHNAVMSRHPWTLRP
jgi:hypothetical protein